MLGIYKLNVDCGRMGDLEGVFVADSEDVDNLIKSKIGVYFGEVLGKHSEVCGAIEPGEITLASDDPTAVKIVVDLDLATGFDPFCYQTYGEAEKVLETDDLLEAVRKWAELKLPPFE